MADISESKKKEKSKITQSVNKIKIQDLNEKKRLSVSPRNPNLNADLQLESH